MKKIGIIDIGTNTIRAVGYRADNIKPICETVFESNILKHTTNSTLSFSGINDLCLVIKKEIEFFKENEILEVYAFATSAMRDVKNFDEVHSFIKEQCEIEIELLSEEDEARCDFLALSNELGNCCSGVGIDLGGGSLQIIFFENGEVEYFSSFPIGVKRLYNKFGKYYSQNKNEILKYINETLSVPRTKSKYLYVMGGTGKTIAKLVGNEFSSDVLDNEKPPFSDEECYDGFMQMSKNTVPYGILVISEIAQKFSAEKIKVMSCGSREGFVAGKL